MGRMAGRILDYCGLTGRSEGELRKKRIETFLCLKGTTSNVL